MSEETIVQDQPTEGQELKPQDQPQQEDRAADLEKRFTELEKRFKAEVSGRDKRISELTKANETLELEKLTEEEKAQKLLENAKQRYEEIERQTAEKERQYLIKDELYNAGLPQTFAKRITGQTQEEIQSDINELKSFLNQQKEELVKQAVNERLGGNPPQAGNNPQAGEISRSEFDNMSPAKKMELIQAGVTIIE